MTTTAPDPAPPQSARRFPAEWLFAAGFSAIGLWVYFHTPVHWEAYDVTLYRDLAVTFFAGFVIMMALAYGESLLRGVSPAERRTWALLAGALAAGVTLGLFIFVRVPRAIVLNRLMESTALGMTFTALALTLFLPVSGLVEPRQVRMALGRGLGLWMPYMAYHAFAGYCLFATRLVTPLVWDPVLMRMDLSLGFNPSRIVHAWADAIPWLRQFSIIAYGLLGLTISGVIARLQIAGGRAHARRALLASLLVGVLGLGCYRLVPAVGPIYAFPADYRDRFFAVPPAGPAATLASTLTGPARAKGPDEIIRNVMPSLHAAFTLVALAAAWSWRRRFFWQCLPLGVLLIASTLLLGLHYFVDLLAAVPLSVFCWWAADRAVRATPCAADTPLPAPAAGGPRHAARWLALALVASVGGLLLWARFAPLPAWIAWPIAAFTVAAPSWAGIRALHQAPRFPCAEIETAPTSGPAPAPASPASGE